MKKNLFLGFIACATLAMTGCTNDGVVAEGAKTQPTAIEFGTYLGRDVQTRGTELTTATLNNFGVFASYTGQDNFGDASTPNFMYNQTVSKSGDAWAYTPLKYWPTTIGDKVSFFAYAPLAAESNNCLTLSAKDATGAPTVTYTYPTDDLTKMVDFVANNQLNQKRTLTGSDVEKVNFTLKHELTRVNILAKVSEDVFKSTGDANKTKVVITGVKFDNTAKFYTKGTYTFNGTTTNERGTWTFADVDKKDLDLKSILNLGEVTNGSYTNNAGIALEGTSPVELFKTTDSKQNYLFLLPVANLTDNDVTVTINYEIVTADTNLKDGYSITKAEKTVKVPAGSLEVGKAYAFTFQINVNTVDFTATVEDWATATTDDVTVDYKDQK